MHRVLAGVAVAGVLAVIALGAREEMLPRAEAADAAHPQAVPQRALARRAAPARLMRPPAAAAPQAAASAPPAGEPARPAAAPAAPAAQPAGAAASAAAVADPGQAQPTAEALMRRAAAAYGKVHSLSAAFVQVVRNPLLGGSTTSRGLLYERRPDRFLMRFSEPAGDVLVSDGRWFWLYYPSVDDKQVIRSAAAGRGQAVDLLAQFLGDPGRRFTPHLEGRATVAGRQAYVLRLVPRGREPFKELKVWLDPVDYLARRLEITDENGSVRHLDLSELRVNPPLSDALFHFTPPAGAHVVTR